MGITGLPQRIRLQRRLSRIWSYCFYLFTDNTSFLHFQIDANFELKKAAAWFQSNHLTLNVSKTKFMIFRNKNMYFDPENCKLKIGNAILETIGTACTKKNILNLLDSKLMNS